MSDPQNTILRLMSERNEWREQCRTQRTEVTALKRIALAALRVRNSKWLSEGGYIPESDWMLLHRAIADSDIEKEINPVSGKQEQSSDE